MGLRHFAIAYESPTNCRNQGRVHTEAAGQKLMGMEDVGEIIRHERADSSSRDGSRLAQPCILIPAP